MKTNQELGYERFKSDKRQLGGLLMLLGATALVFPMANVATLVSPDGGTITTGIPMSSLIGSICVIIMGLLNIPVGYLQAVHDWGHKYVTGFLILWTQTAWIGFITDLTAVGMGARSGEAFIPAMHHPTPGQVKFVGSMGMMGILGYGFGFLGSLAFIEFSLFAFQAGKPGDRPSSYYQGRLRTYAFSNFMVGLSQLMLGLFILANFGNGPLEEPIAVAMYVVHFPRIAVFVGLVQTLNALYALARSFGFHSGENDHYFQATTCFQWLCTVIFQILIQVAYNPGGAIAEAAPSVTMLTLGLSVIVAYLDYKMRSTPESIPDDYYALTMFVEEENTDSADKPEHPAVTSEEV